MGRVESGVTWFGGTFPGQQWQQGPLTEEQIQWVVERGRGRQRPGAGGEWV